MLVVLNNIKSTYDNDKDDHAADALHDDNDDVLIDWRTGCDCVPIVQSASFASLLFRVSRKCDV